jgi:hypothetical protein
LRRLVFSHHGARATVHITRRKDAEFAEAIEDSRRDDNNGSAKVALIGIDRSIAAWAVLRDVGHKQAEDFIRQLDQIRSVAEMVFANARKFIRPGWIGDNGIDTQLLRISSQLFRETASDRHGTSINFPDFVRGTK